MLSQSDDTATEIRTFPVFERRWNWFQTAVQSVIGLVIAAGLAGLFGDGPLAHAEQAVPDTPIVLGYDRFLRAGYPSRMRVGIARPLDAEHLAIDLNADFLERVSVTATQPPAEAADATPAGVTYRFRLGHDRCVSGRRSAGTRTKRREAWGTAQPRMAGSSRRPMPRTSRQPSLRTAPPRTPRRRGPRGPGRSVRR